MIHTRNYRLVFPPERPDVSSGISLDVPVLRTALVRSLLEGNPCPRLVPHPFAEGGLRDHARLGDARG